MIDQRVWAIRGRAVARFHLYGRIVGAVAGFFEFGSLTQALHRIQFLGEAVVSVKLYMDVHAKRAVTVGLRRR